MPELKAKPEPAPPVGGINRSPRGSEYIVRVGEIAYQWSSGGLVARVFRCDQWGGHLIETSLDPCIVKMGSRLGPFLSRPMRESLNR